MPEQDDVDAEREAPAARPGLREAVAALRIRDFRRFWLGAIVSNSGSWMQNVTVPYVLFQLTGSATWVGLASFLQFVPALFMGPLGGSLADRYARRTVILAAQSGLAVASVGLWALWASGAAEAWSLTAVVAVYGAIAGTSIGAWQAFVSELVPRRLLLNAVTLNSAQFNAARAVGPALGGLVLGTLGPSWAFALNALSYVAVLGALLSVRPAPVAKAPRTASVLGELRETVTYVRGMPGIATCIVVVAALGFFGNPVFPLLAVFAEDVFGVSGLRYGILGAALGVGGVLATPLVAGRGSALARSRLVGAALGIYGTALAAFALAPAFPVAVAALVVAGGGYLALASTLNTTIQVQVAEERRGKVLAFYVMGLTSSYPLGSLVQGALADLVSVRLVTAGAGLVLLVVLARLLVTGRLRTMDEDPQEAEARAAA
ncbi:MAG: MFS transporter [Acidimicrobiia bacterium]